MKKIISSMTLYADSKKRTYKNPSSAKGGDLYGTDTFTNEANEYVSGAIIIL